MADPSLVIELARQAWKIVEKGLEHETTARSFGTMQDELLPMLADIQELARKMDLRPEEIQSLERIMILMREARLKYSKIECRNCCLAPCYKEELDRADQSIKDFIQGKLAVQTARTVMEIRHHQLMTKEHVRRPKPLKADLESLPDFTVGLDGPLMNKLRSDLIRDGRDQVFNLTGFAGTGKTTMAKLLCCDMQVRGWFDDNILFVSVGSEIESRGDVAMELQDKLSENGSKAVLVVLDNVERVSSELVEQCRTQISSNPKSKILVISRVALTGLGTRELMTPLEEDDARTLFREIVQPSGTTSYNIPDHETFLQVVKGCGGFPIAIKLIGNDLRGKPIEFWQKLLREWSRQGQSILQTHSDLLARLQHSLQVSEEYKPISEFFMDLGLFPKNHMIPVTALVDIWVELYKQDEDGIDAMILVHHLTAMNLADMVVERRAGSDADNYYNNHFLTQHNILRELAVKYSSDQAETFKRKRLIIEINGPNRPEGWPQSPQGVHACLSLLKASRRQRVAARLLSISTDQKVTPDWCNIQAAEAEVLVLNLQTQEYKLPKFMKKMKNLKVLVLTHYGLYTSELKNLKLLSSLSSLKRIRLEKFSLVSLYRLRNLRKLSFYKCGVMQAFKNSWINISKKLPNLVYLDIEHCKDMMELPPALSNIGTLKKLSISNCSTFSALPKEIEKLQNLELLRVSKCGLFEEMPESMTMLQNLRFLDVSYCASLRQVPKEFAKLSNLNKLYMMGTSIRELPDSIMNMKHLNVVLCDEFVFDFWEAIKHVCPKLEIRKVATFP